LRRPVDQAVERDDAAESAATDRQAREIGNHERPSRVEHPSLEELATRRVGGENRHSSRGQEAGNVRGARADLEHRQSERETVNESSEQQSVERLAVELVGELASVQIRNSVERRRDATQWPHPRAWSSVGHASRKRDSGRPATPRPSTASTQAAATAGAASSPKLREMEVTNSRSRSGPPKVTSLGFAIGVSITR